MIDILFTPCTINQLSLKHRIIMTAMHLGYAKEYRVTRKDFAFYVERAKGGAAAITTVAAVNELAGPLNMHNLADDGCVAGLTDLAAHVRERGSHLFVQLFHCGRNGNQRFLNGKKPIAPSAVPSPLYREVPQVMSPSDIQNTTRDFARAAQRCREAGVAGVEISASAGYLLAQFLSPVTNQREDEYGGTFENRMRFPMEVIGAVRKAVGQDYPVILRISGSDMQGGYGIREMQAFCASLEHGLVDAFNVTGGWHESPVPQISAHLPQGGFTFLAEAVKRVVNVPVIGCNRINSRHIAEKVLEKGLCDFVGAARAFLTDAHFVNKIKNNAPYRKCIACNKGCIDRIFIEKDVRCVLNPSTGREGFEISPAASPKKILVIGSGPAGMEAARNAALRGHKVTIASRDRQFGGLLRAAAKTPFKKDLSHFIDTLTYELNNLDITVFFNTEVDAAYIRAMAPDHVVLATGSTALVPPIPGIDASNVQMAESVLNGDATLLRKLRRGKNIVLGGGSVGLETALFLAEQAFLSPASLDFLNQYVVSNQIRKGLFNPIDIRVVEMGDKVGKDLGGTRWITRAALKAYGVKIMKNSRALAIEDKEIILETQTGDIRVPVDTVILAAGYQSSGGQIRAFLEAEGISFNCIGDAHRPRNIMAALEEALAATRNL